MKEPIDRKFIIRAKKTKDHTEVTEYEAVLFLCKDNILPATLQFYLDESRRQGVDVNQLLSIRLLIDRVNKWRKEYLELCKLPDVEEGLECMNVCKTNE